MGDAVAVSWLVILLLVVLAWLGTRKMREMPSGLQNFLETVVEGLGKFTKSVIGPEGDKFVPLIATLFIYILVMNVLGLIPGFVSPTATLSMTVALALVVFFSTHFHGVKRHGAGKYLKHFVAGSEGLPLLAAIFITPLLLVVHLVGELARPLSLSVRLFGNIFGKEKIIMQLAVLTSLALLLVRIPLLPPDPAFSASPAWLIAIVSGIAGISHLFVLGLGVIVGLVQALIFSLLAAAYFSLAIEQGEAAH
jgi:F-type H+-transporting ATPase subunit a